MNEVEIMAANVALKKMVSDGYFSICVIDKILKLTGGIPDARDYQTLNLLHCVHYNTMPKELLRGLPLLIARVVNSPRLEFHSENGMAGATLRLVA